MRGVAVWSAGEVVFVVHVRFLLGGDGFLVWRVWLWFVRDIAGWRLIPTICLSRSLVPIGGFDLWHFWYGLLLMGYIAAE